MSRSTVNEIIQLRRTAYRRATKTERGRILDELEQLTGRHRKSLVRLLNRPQGVREPDAERSERRRRGRPPVYEALLPQLRKLWAASRFACGKRLAPFVPTLLDSLVRFGEIEVSARQQELLLSLSASTIDRLLASEREAMALKARYGPKPGGLVSSQIPVRTFADWDVTEPGWCELDLVAHCGDSTRGEFLYTLNITDILTGWVTLGGMKGRGQQGAVRALQAAWAQVPFPLRGIDSDNDSAFINAHLLRYCAQHSISFTRCRPYVKNDQCHIEQKNWTVVRSFIGYKRLESEAELALLDQAQRLITAFHNFFWPIQRLVSKERHGAKRRRRYDEAKTPYQRLLACDGALDTRQERALEARFLALNPAELLRQINSLVEQIGGLA